MSDFTPRPLVVLTGFRTRAAIIRTRNDLLFHLADRPRVVGARLCSGAAVISAGARRGLDHALCPGIISARLRAVTAVVAAYTR